jgi:hypothetical protein
MADRLSVDEFAGTGELLDPETEYEMFDFVPFKLVIAEVTEEAEEGAATVAAAELTGKAFTAELELSTEEEDAAIEDPD